MNHAGEQIVLEDATREYCAFISKDKKYVVYTEGLNLGGEGVRVVSLQTGENCPLAAYLPEMYIDSNIMSFKFRDRFYFDWSE